MNAADNKPECQFIDRLDPQLRDDFAARPAVFATGQSLEAIQAECFVPASESGDSHPNVICRDLELSTPAGPVTVRVYQPANRESELALPVILWIHGGGFFLGDLNSDNAKCEQWVMGCACVLVAVDYRLAPQYPFPAGFDDCYAALQWLTTTGVSELNLNPQQIAIGGASAGACLAAGVVLRARDNGLSLCYQLLLIPVLDDRHLTVSSCSVTDPRTWNCDISRQAWEAYLADIEGEVPVYAAPARAENLADLPPTFISIAEHDILRDEALDYAQRLLQADVSTEVHLYPGTYHGSSGATPAARVSLQHQRDITGAIKSAFIGQKSNKY